MSQKLKILVVEAWVFILLYLTQKKERRGRKKTFSVSSWVTIDVVNNGVKEFESIAFDGLGNFEGFCIEDVLIISLFLFLNLKTKIQKKKKWVENWKIEIIT